MFWIVSVLFKCIIYCITAAIQSTAWSDILCWLTLAIAAAVWLSYTIQSSWLVGRFCCVGPVRVVVFDLWRHTNRKCSKGMTVLTWTRSSVSEMRCWRVPEVNRSAKAIVYVRISFITTIVRSMWWILQTIKQRLIWVAVCVRYVRGNMWGKFDVTLLNRYSLRGTTIWCVLYNSNGHLMVYSDNRMFWKNVGFKHT